MVSSIFDGEQDTLDKNYLQISLTINFHIHYENLESKNVFQT